MKAPVLALCLFVVTGVISAETLAPVMPKNLKSDDQGAGQLIPFENGVLIKGDVFYIASFGSPTPKPLVVKGIDAFLDVEKCGEFLYAWVARGKSVKLAGLDPLDGGWHDVSIPRNGNLGTLVASRLGVAVMGQNQIWWQSSDRQWKHKVLPEPKQLSKGVPSSRWGSVRYLDRTKLLIGWDRGEWGGMLAELDLTAENPSWNYLSGREKNSRDLSGIPGNNPVKAIVGSGMTELWVATGLAHLTGLWRGLFHFTPEKSWQRLIDGEFDEDRGTIKLPAPSDINSLAVDAHGRIYFLAGKLGVFEVVPDQILPILLFDFYSVSEERKSADSPTPFSSYIVGAYPHDLCVTPDGDIFVSTSYFGVLAFHKVGDKWHGRQIMLPKAPPPQKAGK